MLKNRHANNRVTHHQSSIQPSHSDVGLDRLKAAAAACNDSSKSQRQSATKKSIPIQLSRSDAQLNYDRRVPDVLNPEIIEEEDNSLDISNNNSKKGKNSRKTRRQKRKKQSVTSASGELLSLPFVPAVLQTFFCCCVLHIV